MYKRTCVICGKPIKKGLYCEEHKSKKIESKKEVIEKIKVCTICGRYFVKGKWVENLRDIEYKYIEKTICPRCKRITSRSYNFIIQLRGDGSKFEEIIRTLSKKYIIKDIIQLKEGIDIKMDLTPGEKRKIISFFKKQNYDILITRKLVTKDRQTSRNVYRVFVRVRV